MKNCMNKFVVMAVLAVAVSGRHSSQAAVPAAGELSIPDALSGLSSADYGDRRKAMTNIEGSLVRQGGEWLNMDDPEAQAGAVRLLKFNRRLTSWLLEIANLPKAQRQSLIQSVSSPSFTGVSALIFSDSSADRAAGVRALGRISSDSVDDLLIYFLHDESLGVAFASMEVIWDRPANEKVVDVLWEMGMNRAMAKAFSPDVPLIRPTYAFRDWQIAGWPVMPAIMSGPGSHPDAEMACAVLAHLKGPHLEALMNKMLNTLAQRLNAPGEDPAISITKLRDPFAALTGLAGACNYKSTIPPLYALATSPVSGKREFGAAGRAGIPLPYYTTRSSALAAVIALTKQDPASYGLAQGRSWTGGWAAPNKEAEQSAVEKLQEWWKTNAAQFATTDHGQP